MEKDRKREKKGKRVEGWRERQKKTNRKIETE